MLTVVLVLALVFTMVNVQTFASQGHAAGTFQWWIAWLLDPMASLTMATAIVFEWVLASYGRREGWLTATKWFAGMSTLVMNTWASLFGLSPSPSGVVLHIVAPALLLLLAESAPRARRHLSEVTADLLDRADRLETPAPAAVPAPTPVVAAPPPSLPAPPSAPPAVSIPPAGGAGSLPDWVTTWAGSVQEPKTEHSKRPPRTLVTPELLAKVRAWRAKRMAEGLPVGRRSMTDPESGLALSDGLARKVQAELNTEPHLRATS